MERAYALGAPSTTMRTMDVNRVALIHHGRATALADTRYDEARGLVADAKWDTLLAVPIVYHDQPLGMLVACYDPERDPDTEEIQFIEAIGDQAAIAIENARLFNQASAVAALEERQRLARELHDSVSQALYGIALGARTARRRLGESVAANVAEPLDYVLTLAEAGLTEMRALIFELRPESLESEGLIAAITRQAASTQARYGVRTSVDLPQQEPAAPLPIKEAAYRITQETLHNTVKHARASNVAIHLTANESAIELEISDDGLGFDPQGEFPGHLGLRSMRERASGVGGDFEVESAPGKGTRVTLRVPLPQAVAR
jgi:signal transduction histidine kinase